MEYGYYTPAELAAMKAQMEQQYADNVALNNQLSTVSNMTKNVSPLGNLGIMLGTLGGKWAAQRYNDVFDKNVYNQRQLNQAINKANLDFQYGPKFHGAGLPSQGAFTSQLPDYFPNSKFYVNGQEYKPTFNGNGWINISGWQRPESEVTSTNTNPAPVTNNTTPSNNTAPSTTNNPVPSTALFGWDNPNLDWRNQNYFSNVTRPPYFSIQ